MPRRLDGPMLEQIPQKVLDNALSGRISDLLDRVMGNADRPGDAAHAGGGFQQHGPLLGDLFNHDHPATPPVGEGGHSGQPRDRIDIGSQAGAPDGAPAVQNWHDLNPDAAGAAAASKADSGTVALQHFDPDGDLGRHLDHFNSQALSMHPDWFML